MLNAAFTIHQQHSPFNIQVFFNVEWCLRECCSLVHPAPHTFSGSQTQLSHTHSTRNARGAHSSPTCRAQRSRSRKPETELTEHTVEFVTHDTGHDAGCRRRECRGPRGSRAHHVQGRVRHVMRRRGPRARQGDFHHQGGHRPCDVLASQLAFHGLVLTQCVPCALFAGYLPRSRGHG